MRFIQKLVWSKKKHLCQQCGGRLSTRKNELYCRTCGFETDLIHQREFENNILNDSPLERIDAIAMITNTRATGTPFGPNYRGCCRIKMNYNTSSIIASKNNQPFELDQPSEAEVSFLSPKAYPATLWVGRRIELCEGERIVGTMTITEIRDPMLDRSSVFSDRENILGDRAVLNLALKHHIAVGPELRIPLQIKLMHYIPDLSGNDIETVSKYIEEVANDILWRIYYDSYDHKTETFSIDCQKVVTEKYPWIDRSNLISLESQGRYFAWRG